MEPVIIIGAGVSGLSCAGELHRHGIAVRVVEAAEEVGGRIATHTVDGFRCDRGFQVLPVADPLIARHLDLDRLRLGAFARGACIYRSTARHHLADPRRHPAAGLQALAGPWSWRSLLRLARWGWRIHRQGPPTQAAGTSIAAELDACGLDGTLRSAFLQPWLAGITLDPDLQADAAGVHDYVRAFLMGPACLPAGGMAAVPRQLAERLPADALLTGTPVDAITAEGVRLRDGTVIGARAVVVAADGSEASRLLAPAAADAPAVPAPAWRGVQALHFALPAADDIASAWLVLDGDGPGPIASLTFPSRVAADYAPAGWDVATVAVLPGPAHRPGGLDAATFADAQAVEAAVRSRLGQWYGAERTAAWRLLRHDHIRQALPTQTTGDLTPWTRSHRLSRGLFLCGDHRTRPGTAAAIASGLQAAQAVLQDR